MLRRVALLLPAAVLAAAVPALLAPGEASQPALPRPVVAVIDTGLRATHSEFDYRGPRSGSDQLVGWWDFTSERKGRTVLPTAGQTWDPQVPEPYDGHGHGTGTASMAVGLNRGAAKSPSAAPGYPLAVAKVGTSAGRIEGDLAAAVRWAVRDVRASVISISIASIVPAPAVVVGDVYDAIEDARAAGVLVVVANGNGWGNVGVLPGDPGWASWYASSTDVLAVGAAGIWGPLVTTDPEVTAEFVPRVATDESDTSYEDAGGTSFSAPFVAGMAARLVAEARAAGKPADPDRVERLLKHSARGTAVPPQFEGYGELDLAVLPAALGHARAGTLPARPSPDPDAVYVETVGGTLRTVWSDVLR